MCRGFERTKSTRLTVLQTLPFYDARDSGSASPNKRKAVLACIEVPGCLVLEKWAQMVLVKHVNDQCGLVVWRALRFFVVWAPIRRA